MTILPFLGNAIIATIGAMLLTATEFRSTGAGLLTFNGLCAIFCALQQLNNPGDRKSRE